MRVGVVLSDLILFSRIESVAVAEGAELQRVDRPQDLDAELDLILVDWSARAEGWTAALRECVPVPVILFGPHTDLAAHADARAAGLGPMMARSKLVASLAAGDAPLRRMAATGRR
jgi:hypothetical protein